MTQEPSASSPSPPKGDGKREVWRRVEEGEHQGLTGEGKVAGEYSEVKTGRGRAAAGLGSILGQRK